MKQIIIIRHAKSSWDYSVKNDFDRSLNSRGYADAMTMANRLFDKKIKIDAIISSPAKRAITTATYFAETFNIKENNIIKVPELYQAPAAIFYTVIEKINDSFNTVAIFAHNPGITDFVNDLTKVKIDNMPTCAAFSVNATPNHWKLFPAAEKQFLFFEYPK